MRTRVKALERDLVKLVGPVKPKHRGSPKKLVILLLMWITPGLPPPGPFG